MLRPDEYFSLFICGHCVLVAIGLLFKALNGRNVLQAISFLFFSYVKLISLLITSRLIYDIPELCRTQIPFGYSLSPLIYLYLRSFTRERPAMRRIDILHFVPVPIFVMMVFHYQSLPYQMKIITIDTIYSGSSGFSLWSGFSLSVFIIYTILITIRLKAVFRAENPLHRRLFFVFFMFLSWIVLTAVKMFGMRTNLVELWRIVDFIYNLELIIVYLFMQRYPIMMSYAQMSTAKKVKNNPILDTVDVESLKQDISVMMEEEQLFCDEDLNLKRLSNALAVNSHQLSAFLNEHYKKNFNTFINSYRIDYACTQIKSDPDINILSTAFSSGFNSYSAFFSAFKKETGKSPREYKNSCIKG